MSEPLRGEAATSEQESAQNRKKLLVKGGIIGGVVLLVIGGIIALWYCLGGSKGDGSGNGGDGGGGKDVMRPRDAPVGDHPYLEKGTLTKFDREYSTGMKLMGAGASEADPKLCRFGVALYVNEAIAKEKMEEFEGQSAKQLSSNMAFYEKLTDPSAGIPFIMQFRFPDACETSLVPQSVLKMTFEEAKEKGLGPVYATIEKEVEKAGGIRSMESLRLDASLPNTLKVGAADAKNEALVTPTSDYGSPKGPLPAIAEGDEAEEEGDEPKNAEPAEPSAEEEPAEPTEEEKTAEPSEPSADEGEDTGSPAPSAALRPALTALAKSDFKDEGTTTDPDTKIEWKNTAVSYFAKELSGSWAWECA
uniref:Uncharacterized protein n=1 Tax=Chromera velia CCMP2878 TaxID=1169474 RepID=A0A0G4I9V3_9ALVE|eukprot:Cvel_12261.t1-p1 / transcript=Cvel_12261.t1 / gene=Cvel_12261 / organism=Chromera_velia_CCMP2878 / gene_product=hypothetical protein / transcript_product=hypothetical protein / location=Cvel_scaffold794:22333-23749(-) / protein_length=361 / sequence_SO=supercontig / SO=protein_coding / is_pseudo=false